MATNTTNLNLIKPSGTDKIRIAQINQNMDILDEKIGPVGNTSLQAQIAAVDSGLAIVSNGNTHVAIASGQYVYIRNHSSLSEGLYKAKAAIAANVALSTSNVTKLTTGSANDLKSAIDSLNSHIEYNSNTAITNLDSIPVNSQGRITLGGSVSPSGNEVTVNFQCYGVSTRKTLEISSVNSGNSWTSVYNGTSWSSWVSITDQMARRAEKRVQGGETASFTFSSYNTSALIFGAVGDSDAILYIFSNGYLIPAKTSSRLNVSLSSDYKTITVSVVSGTGHIGCISANLQPTVT